MGGLKLLNKATKEKDKYNSLMILSYNEPDAKKAFRLEGKAQKYYDRYVQLMLKYHGK